MYLLLTRLPSSPPFQYIANPTVFASLKIWVQIRQHFKWSSMPWSTPICIHHLFPLTRSDSRILSYHLPLALNTRNYILVTYTQIFVSDKFWEESLCPPPVLGLDLLNSRCSIECIIAELYSQVIGDRSDDRCSQLNAYVLLVPHVIRFWESVFNVSLEVMQSIASQQISKGKSLPLSPYSLKKFLSWLLLVFFCLSYVVGVCVCVSICVYECIYVHIYFNSFLITAIIPCFLYVSLPYLPFLIAS